MNVLDFETLFRRAQRAQGRVSIEAAGQLGKGLGEAMRAAMEGREIPGSALLKSLRAARKLARWRQTRAKNKFPVVYEKWLKLSRKRSVSIGALVYGLEDE